MQTHSRFLRQHQHYSNARLFCLFKRMTLLSLKLSINVRDYWNLLSPSSHWILPKKEYGSVVFKSKGENTFRQNCLPNYSGDIALDNLGRLHLPTPYSEKVNLFLRANKFNSSTIATHVSNLHRIFSGHPCTSVVMLAAMGSYYTSLSIVKNFFIIGCLKNWTLIYFLSQHTQFVILRSTQLSMFCLLWATSLQLILSIGYSA